MTPSPEIEPGHIGGRRALSPLHQHKIMHFLPYELNLLHRHPKQDVQTNLLCLATKLLAVLHRITISSLLTFPRF